VNVGKGIESLIMRMTLLLAMLLAAPVRAAFEKGGVLDTDPRSGALGGVVEPGSREAVAAGVNPAGFALLEAPAVTTGGGVSSAASLAASGLSGGGQLEGLGLGGGFTQVTGTRIAERTVRVGLGLPAADLAGAGFGAAVKFRRADYGSAHATGFGLDLGAVTAVPVPWDRLAVAAAAGIEDLLGSLDWSGGLGEPVARQTRFGVAAKWGGQLTGVVEARFIRAAARNEQLLGLGVEQTFLIRGVGLALRAGWRDGTLRNAAVTGGIGAGYGPVTVDYAVAGAGVAGGAIHLVSASWAFPGGAGWTPGTSAPRSSHAPGEVVPDQDPVVFASAYASTCFRIRAPHVEQIAGWTVLITDPSGRVVWSQEGDGFPPLTVKWTGVGLDGEMAPPGEYLCQLVLKGPGTWQYVSPESRFRLARPVDRTAPRELHLDDGPGGF